MDGVLLHKSQLSTCFGSEANAKANRSIKLCPKPQELSPPQKIEARTKYLDTNMLEMSGMDSISNQTQEITREGLSL